MLIFQATWSNYKSDVMLNTIGSRDRNQDTIEAQCGEPSISLLIGCITCLNLCNLSYVEAMALVVDWNI